MALFARVPVVPGKVLEVYEGDELFPMTEELAVTWYLAPEGVSQGYNFDGNVFVAPANPTNEELLVDIRAMRDKLLAECDYTMMIDTPISAESKQNFITYRQSLRDFPDICDPQNPIWPVKPEYVKN